MNLEKILGRPTFAGDFWTRVLADDRERMTPVADVGHAETRLWGAASGSGKYSADAPGEAMRIVESSLGGHDHAYTDFHDREGNLLRFGRRLAEGILRNLQADVMGTG